MEEEMGNNLNEALLTEIHEKVLRIEKGVEEIYKLLKTPISVGGKEKATTVSDAHCNEHGVAMEKRWSEKKQKNYLAHNNEEGQICFGKGYLAKG